MPAPAATTATRRPTAPSTNSAPNSPYTLPALSDITHVKTAARSYTLANYKQAIFIPAPDRKAVDDAVKKGGDPLALRLFSTDVLVLIKADGTTRIIPLATILEFNTEKSSSR